MAARAWKPWVGVVVDAREEALVVLGPRGFIALGERRGDRLAALRDS
jgi:hypothetical protein